MVVVLAVLMGLFEFVLLIMLDGADDDDDNNLVARDPLLVVVLILLCTLSVVGRLEDSCSAMVGS